MLLLHLFEVLGVALNLLHPLRRSQWHRVRARREPLAQENEEQKHAHAAPDGFHALGEAALRAGEEGVDERGDDVEDDVLHLRVGGDGCRKVPGRERERERSVPSSHG